MKAVGLVTFLICGELNGKTHLESLTGSNMGKPTERQIREFEKIKKRAKKLGLGDMFMDKKYATRTSKEQQDLFKQGKSKLDGYKNLSKHQTGRAVDAYFKGVENDKEQIKRLKKLKKDARDEGINYGEIPWDMGHFEFEIPKKEIIEAKGKYLFGSPMNNEIPKYLKRPEDDIASKIIDEVTMGVADQVNRADESARIAATDEGRRFIDKSIDQQAASRVINPYVANQIKKEIKRNPASIVENKQKVLEQSQRNEKPSVKDNFMEALTFFLPSIGGLVVGGLIGGAEGAVLGEERGASLGTGLREYKLKKSELEKKDALDPLELERLEISKQNLKARQDQLKLERQRAEGLEEERDDRRYERSQDRVLKQKEQFTKQADVKNNIEQLRQISDLENLAEVKVLPGTIGFKIAKGIAGEVGNLTEEERQAAQIAPSLWNRIKRYAVSDFKGEIPESDVKLIKEVGAKLKGKIKTRLRNRATKFASSRSKNLHEAHAATFRDDILLDIGISPEEGEAPKGGTSSMDVSVDRQLEIIKKIKAKRGK
jgi:hypothetical protein